MTESADPSRELEALVRRFDGLLRGTGARHGLDASDVDAVVQDVRIRLWKALGGGERMRTASASYLYITAISAARDLLRRRRARPDSSPEPLDDRTTGIPRRVPHADAALEEREMLDTIERAIGEITESRRGVVRMHLAGYGREEIADLLGWSEAKTRNLLYRGLTDLRGRLVGLGIGPEGWL